MKILKPFCRRQISQKIKKPLRNMKFFKGFLPKEGEPSRYHALVHLRSSPDNQYTHRKIFAKLKNLGLGEKTNGRTKRHVAKSRRRLLQKLCKYKRFRIFTKFQLDTHKYYHVK